MFNWKSGLILACTGGFTLLASAQTPQKVETVNVEAVALKARQIPVETFFRRAEFNQMVLSPSGDKLAAVSPFKGRGNLVVIDLAKRTRQIVTSFETMDVAQFHWVNNKRLCLRVADGQEVTGRVNYRGTYCINDDSSNLRDFTRLGVSASGAAGSGTTVNIVPVRAVGPDSPEYIVSMRLRSRDSADLYSFNTETGQTKLLTFDTPGKVAYWTLDRNKVPRVAVSDEDRVGNQTFTMRNVWLRSGEGAKWEKIFEFKVTWGQPHTEALEPMAFDYDNTTLYVSTNVGGRDKRAIYKYDTTTKKLGELVFEHPLIDVEGGLLFSDEKKKLVGIRYSAEMPATKWLDPELDNLQKQLDATLPGNVNQIGVVEEKSKRLLLTSASATNAGEYFLFDNEKKAIEPLVKRRDWLPANLMSERKFMKYKARDGMEIPAWVTIPKGSTGKNLPLIVHIHGGPAVRAYSGLSHWGRPEAQFFASRGYVVIEPEPRGSTGFGRKHYESSFKQWGLTMQDDITDGALHLVKEGIVDKNRMCLFGGSYGGYASLQGVVRDPDLWKCSAPFVAVSDLFLLQTVQHSDIAQGSDALETEFTVVVGDSKKDYDLFMRTSPAKNTDKIKTPIFIAMGSDDVRVPLIHAEEFVKNLKDKGGKVEMVVYTGEGHGFNKDSNVIDFYTRLEKFFDQHIGKK
jgi:dipeptidyl aminopeptidase/acylaminoacyl peptidase